MKGEWKSHKKPTEKYRKQRERGRGQGGGRKVERQRGDGGEKRQLLCISAYLENYEIKAKIKF